MISIVFLIMSSQPSSVTEYPPVFKTNIYKSSSIKYCRDDQYRVRLTPRNSREMLKNYPTDPACYNCSQRHILDGVPSMSGTPSDMKKNSLHPLPSPQ